MYRSKNLLRNLLSNCFRQFLMTAHEYSGQNNFLTLPMFGITILYIYFFLNFYTFKKYNGVGEGPLPPAAIAHVCKSYFLPRMLYIQIIIHNYLNTDTI
jgi:hypothetical protein